MADDSQVYGSCSPASVDDFSSRISECVGAVLSWVKSNRLSLNCDKTKVCGARQVISSIHESRTGVGTSALALVMHLPSSIPSSQVQIDLDTVHLPVATQLLDSELFGCETKGHHQLKAESLEHWT